MVSRRGWCLEEDGVQKRMVSGCGCCPEEDGV